MPADDQSYEKSIATLAYQLWESRGRPAGSAEQDWLEAKAMLAVRGADSPGRGIPERRKSRAKKSTTTRRGSHNDSA
jgi:hypothetical protein